jgi:hypothetical protein
MMAMHWILSGFLQQRTLSCALLGAAVATSAVFLPATAQTPGAGGDAATLMVGAWELSNSDHDKTCAITFRLDATGPGRALDFDKSCAEMFPETRTVAAWTMGKDAALRLIDPRGKPVLEFIEVENGLFEPLHPGGTLYFLQTAAAAQGRQYTADQMFGDWAFVRGTNRQICQMSLLDVAADPESFALSLLLLLLSERNDPWRFEEGDPGVWHRIPEGRQPLLLIRP